MSWPLLFILSSLSIAAPRSCLTNTLDLLTDYHSSPKASAADGSAIINIHNYMKGLEKNPKWKPLVDKIRDARKIQAPKLNAKRTTAEQAPGYGYERMKRDAHNLRGKTVEEAFEKFNVGAEYELVQEGAKIVITPKNKVLGQQYVEVLYDISGNYFRLQRGTYRGNKSLTFLADRQRYLDWEGNLINTENVRDPEVFETLMHKSHWNAQIE